MLRAHKVIIFLILTGSVLLNAQTTVTPLNEEGIGKLLKERQGKFLLLNLWATWCAPCREEFPDLQKIHEVYSEKGLEVVGLSVDYPDETESKIVPFLMKAASTFLVYVQNVSNDEALINMIDQKWNGAVPLTVIYDPNGNKIAKIEGKKSFAEFESILKKHLPSAE